MCYDTNMTDKNKLHQESTDFLQAVEVAKPNLTHEERVAQIESEYENTLGKQDDHMLKTIGVEEDPYKYDDVQKRFHEFNSRKLGEPMSFLARSTRAIHRVIDKIKPQA